MEKVCEFCKALRPVIYCKSDVAQLCLSCDAKVHSANALSQRHPRTLVCQACRHHPAYVRCFEHGMFVCRGCDGSLHKDSSQHQKRVIRSYMGCPSAQDFAVLWGFELSELDNTAAAAAAATIRDRFASTSSVSSQHTKAFHGKQQKTCIIRQQIIDLERLQLSEGDKNSSNFIRGRQQEATVAGADQSLQHSLSLDLGGTAPHRDMNVEPFSSPFHPLERLAPTFANSLQGDLLWQCKSPSQSSELWSQNMQDLGICEELGCFDDFNMPDVDLTFRNFEEVFGSDKDLIRPPYFDEKDVTCSSVDKDKNLDGLDHSHAESIEVMACQDVWVASSVNNDTQATTDKDNDIGPSSQASNCFSSIKDCSCPIRPSLLSLSRFSTDESSSATDYMDTRYFSPVNVATQEEPRSISPKRPEMEAKRNAKMRCKDKKKTRRGEKQTQYESQKARDVAWNHVNGEFVKAQGHKRSDEITTTRSY